jgi:hypothetical protein
LKHIDLSSLLAASSNVAMFTDKIAQMIEPLGEHGMVELRPDRVALFFRSICSLIDTAEWLELPATASSAKEAQGHIARLGQSNRPLIGRQLCSVAEAALSLPKGAKVRFSHPPVSGTLRTFGAFRARNRLPLFPEIDEQSRGSDALMGVIRSG